MCAWFPVDQFNGGVVVVTHDARLIEATECRLWIVDEQEVTPWQGTTVVRYTERCTERFTEWCEDDAPQSMLNNDNNSGASVPEEPN